MTEQTGNRHFRNLIHWQKAQSLAREVFEMVRRLPKERAYEILGAQILRSAGSIPANIAEGYGRFSPAAYRNHLSIARGSLFETQSWLDLLSGDGVISREQASHLDSACEELARILTSRMKALDAKNPRMIREEGPQYDV